MTDSVTEADIKAAAIAISKLPLNKENSNESH